MDNIDFDIVVMEFHGDGNRRRIDQLLHDYVLVGGEIVRPHRGTLKYAHRRLLSA
jgi:hypothetical protein